MHLAFLDLAAEERGLYFQQAALRRGLQPAILEKDFWVCWLLGLLFERPDPGDALVFKGGTSLSKVFGVIQRFSEDIDLSLTPSYVGIAEDEVERAGSRAQRDAWMERLETASAVAARERLQPMLEHAIREELGKPTGELGWTECAIDEASRSPVILFRYPTTQEEGFAYLARSVKIELGSLTDQRPTVRHGIEPWIAEVLPDSFPDWRCEVVALEAERTYWEKATILHAEYHRPPERRTPERYSRHYADMAALALHPQTREAAGRHDLRERVVRWKSLYFGSAWARYDLARPDTFRLSPHPQRMEMLEADYAAMRDMYMTDPPAFADVVRTLTDLERTINVLGQAK